MGKVKPSEWMKGLLDGWEKSVRELRALSEKLGDGKTLLTESIRVLGDLSCYPSEVVIRLYATGKVEEDPFFNISSICSHAKRVLYRIAAYMVEPIIDFKPTDKELEDIADTCSEIVRKLVKILEKYE